MLDCNSLKNGVATHRTRWLQIHRCRYITGTSLQPRPQEKDCSSCSLKKAGISHSAMCLRNEKNAMRNLKWVGNALSVLLSVWQQKQLFYSLYLKSQNQNRCYGFVLPRSSASMNKYWVYYSTKALLQPFSYIQGNHLLYYANGNPS